MVEGKDFHANKKHQYRVSQCGEHNYSDYYEYLSLTHFMDEHYL